MKQAIDDLKDGLEDLKTESKRLNAAATKQEGELLGITLRQERIRNKIKEYESALRVLGVAEGHAEILTDGEDK